jgi:asparagine synthase (glutamine-hydrolysing)
MCGIAGIMHPTLELNKAVEIVGNMLSRIGHRGPDESGIYSGKRITLGSVRLSIIDMVKGQQPLTSADGRYRIVYNGEIFNYIELRNELRYRGYRFRTDSDTEVLLNAYIEYGNDCLAKLNGQFAFSIWDSESESLFLARDRSGVRPLFYTWCQGCFLFGSEIKALFEFPGIKKEIDPFSLAQIFCLWTTITPRTVFKDVLEISPGHFMEVTPDSVKTTPYWSLSFPSSADGVFKGSMEAAVEELDALLTDAVRIRLRSDVPVAAYLSGGLDSGATTALISKIAPGNLRTFSIGFEDAEFDETPYQQEVSHYLNTQHTAFVCTHDDISQFFPNVIWHTEIPILRTAAVPMYCLSKKVRNQGIKVVITGEGADEALAGYDIYKEGIIRAFWAKQPNSRLRPKLFNRLYPYLTQFQGRNKDLLRLFYGFKLEETESPFYSHMLRWHNTSGLFSLLNEDMKPSAGELITQPLEPWLPDDFNRYSLLSKAQWIESFLFMSGYLLSSQGDRVGMANSVEGRYPFLDHRIIEFAASLPPDFKLHGLNEKYILKKMMLGRLPASVLKRPKQAYRAPGAKALLSPSSPGCLIELLSEASIKKTGVFNAAIVDRLVQKALSSDQVTESDNMALSAVLSTQLIIHQYILEDPVFKPGLIPLNNIVMQRETNPKYK